MQKNDSKNKTGKLEERIAELQSNVKFSFKQTSEVIDIIYRTAIDDYRNSKLETIEESTIKEDIDTLEKLKKSMSNTETTASGRKRFGSKTSEVNESTATVLYAKAQTEIKNLGVTLAKKQKEVEELKKKLKSLDSNTDYRGGQLSALKYCLEVLDDYDRIESYEIIRKKFNSLNKQNTAYKPL